MSSIVYMAVVRANARMKLRVLGTLLGRSNDAQYTSAARQEAHFREGEWDNYLRHGPRGQAEYHHGFEPDSFDALECLRFATRHFRGLN